MRPHEKLDVWKKAIDFVVAVYRATEAFQGRKVWTDIAIAQSSSFDPREYC